MKQPKEIKDCMFQYATAKGWGDPIIEDTGLISREEADELWNKYYPDFIKRLEGGEGPEMCIWTDCKTTTSYHQVAKELDYRDNLVVKDGVIYKTTHEPIV